MERSETWAEATFREVVDICSDATGSNAAFDPEYGMNTLNALRLALGLSAVTRERMEELLS